MKVKVQTKRNGCSSCGCAAPSEKTIVIEYLYLDLQTCDRCIGTDNILDGVVKTLVPALEIAGYKLEYKKIEMKTADFAQQYQFLSSPTIRVNGQDICTSVQENSCGCCSDISGTDVDCRVFEHNGKTYEIPPAELLAESIFQAVFAPKVSSCSCSYEMPENLKSFFEGKTNKSKCTCGDTCC